MKNIKEYMVSEAKKTDFEKIENLGETWIKEWGAAFCGNVLASVMKGIQKGMKDNPYKKDDKFQKTL